MTSTQPKLATMQEYHKQLDALIVGKAGEIAARHIQKAADGGDVALRDLQAEAIALLLYLAEMHQEQVRIFKENGDYLTAGMWMGDAAQLTTHARILRDMVMP